MKAWIARDSDGGIAIFQSNKPYKGAHFWVGSPMCYVNEDNFPQVKWEDEEPTEVEITIKIKED